MRTPKGQIVEYLRKTGLKAYHLADLAKISRPSIYKFLNGQMDLKLKTWVKIEKVINKHDSVN